MSISCVDKSLFAKKPRAVLLDLDNTLYSFAPAHEAAMRAAVEKANRGLGIGESDFLGAFDKARKAIKKRLGGTSACHSRLLYMQETLEGLGLKTQLYMALDLEQTYWRIFMASAVLFPGVREFLESLRRAGIATAIVTDLGVQIQFRKLIYFSLNDCFDFVVTSEEAGAEKPASAPFERALEKLGVPPDAAIMIGDDAGTDILGARRLGIPAAQKRHAGVDIFNDERKPDLIFDQFPELERFFASCGWLEAAAKPKRA